MLSPTHSQAMGDLKDANHQYRLGQHYADKSSPDYSLISSEEWFQKAALQGHLDAQFELAALYSSGAIAREPSFIVPALSVRWMRAAASQGHLEAQFRLATFLRDGIGTPKDIEKALIWYERAAYSDHVTAMSEVANLYRTGYDQNGSIEKNPKRALFWYERLALVGDLNGLFMQGHLYSSGSLGPSDYAIAMQKYRECARQEHASCQRKMADFYRDGKGVGKNTILALFWYEKAYANGDGSSIDWINSLKAEQSKPKSAQRAPSKPTSRETGELIGTILKALLERYVAKETHQTTYFYLRKQQIPT